MKMKFTGKKVEIIHGDMKGTIGDYLGTDGYVSARGVTCKILINNMAYSFIWDAFQFIDPEVQEAWDNDDNLEELDFDC